MSYLDPRELEAHGGGVDADARGGAHGAGRDAVQRAWVLLGHSRGGVQRATVGTLAAGAAR